MVDVRQSHVEDEPLLSAAALAVTDASCQQAPQASSRSGLADVRYFFSFLLGGLGCETSLCAEVSPRDGKTYTLSPFILCVRECVEYPVKRPHRNMAGSTSFVIQGVGPQRGGILRIEGPRGVRSPQ